jgi:hypothetical protein
VRRSDPVAPYPAGAWAPGEARPVS